ncbi:SpoIIE family protein phosphatase [Streptomyces sp. MCA2]|uniref:SpoIIE family protein phosphatase n=1 Tax=Streptomyces sp. MCA2 TaxID=2944805 RepID=UPI0020211A22|nr:SpoIIE family protein phosphatase [Streptomyces sp. MCA2]MCL7496041.1 SpoIIE family protein phosphatase [Streptomyces sp. MCA2]
MNRLVETVRSWLDQASVTVTAFHRRLTADHFHDQLVPSLRKLRDLLAGEDLSWELVEAAADVCFPGESATQTETRLAPLRELWEVAQAAPAAVSGDVLPSVARELLEAKDRTIAAYQEIDRARQAFQASERGRLQALQMATMVFVLLGQAQATIADLKRQVDGLQIAVPPAPAQLALVEQHLKRAVVQEHDLRSELGRAEHERDTAQQVADHAARRIQQLERELAQLRDEGGQPPETPVALDALPVVREADVPAGSAAFEQIEEALGKVRSVLDREHEAVQEAADEVGWHPMPDNGAVVAGEVLDTEVGLSRTTADNPPSGETGADAQRYRQAGTERVRYVGAATRRIARGTDLDETLVGLCRAVVPTFADAILVYLRDPLPVGDERPTGPVVLRLRRTDRMPEKPGTDGARLPVLPAQPDLGSSMGSAAERVEVQPGGALAKVLRGVRPLVGEAPAAGTALAELLGPITRLPSGHRVVLAPLRGRRRVIGTAVYVRRADRPAFEPDDLLVAAQLATHTALSVEKTILDGREAFAAGALQRRMLPDALPELSGIRLASRYLLASDTARVGGDWYDAFPLPGGRVALVVGDVMGHSMTEAAVMGQLRAMTQPLAGEGLPPQEVLRRLDRVALDLSFEVMATCLFAVYDPVVDQVFIANAGHPPPVMLHRGGRAEVLRVPPGAPIGVGGVDFEAVALDAPAGATLVLYTDGLVESRIRDVWTGIEQLRERLTQTARLTGPNPPPLEPLCDEVLDMLGPGDRDDDIALLAARFDGGAHPRNASARIRPQRG